MKNSVIRKYDLGAICIGAIIALLAFLTINNLFAGIGIGALFIAYYFLLLRRKFKNYILDIEKLHCCYNFINTFLISLSVKESLDDAFEAATRRIPYSLEIVLNEIGDMTTEQKLEYLVKYFNYSIFRMLVNLVKLHIEQGGNILKMADSLISETRRIEEAVIESENISRRKMGEFIILWSMVIVVLVFMRFALTNFYFMMLKSQIFVILLLLFYLLILLSVHLFTMKYVRLPVKEESRYE